MIPYQFVDTRRLGVKIVKEFFDKVHTEDKEFDAFTKIPSESNKNNIRFFHGARDEESIKEIYKY